MEMSGLTRDETAAPVSLDQILRRERGQGNINFPCSADHEQDWQPYPVDPYSCYMCDYVYMHTYTSIYISLVLSLSETCFLGGYECGEVFPPDLGPDSPSRDAAN